MQGDATRKLIWAAAKDRIYASLAGAFTSRTNKGDVSEINYCSSMPLKSISYQMMLKYTLGSFDVLMMTE